MKDLEQCGIVTSKGKQIGLIRGIDYRLVIRSNLENCIQAWSPYHKKGVYI